MSSFFKAKIPIKLNIWSIKAGEYERNWSLPVQQNLLPQRLLWKCHEIPSACNYVKLSFKFHVEDVTINNLFLLQEEGTSPLSHTSTTMQIPTAHWISCSVILDLKKQLSPDHENF